MRERVLLVEGASDEAAVRTVAVLLGLDLAATGTDVVAMGGITNLRRHLAAVGTAEVSVLCDHAEAAYVRAVVAAGDVEAVVHVCVADLEDELVRALGVDRTVGVLTAAGDLDRFATLQRQPAWRDAPFTDQVRRFIGAGSGRKLRHARALSAALSPAEVPAPLRDLLGRRPR